MRTSFELVADSTESARQMAINQARAMGYSRIEGVFTASLGDRKYRVEMTVSK